MSYRAPISGQRALWYSCHASLSAVWKTGVTDKQRFVSLRREIHCQPDQILHNGLPDSANCNISIIETNANCGRFLVIGSDWKSPKSRANARNRPPASSSRTEGRIPWHRSEHGQGSVIIYGMLLLILGYLPSHGRFHVTRIFPLPGLGALFLVKGVTRGYA